MQHSVDAHADAKALFVRLDVDIAGAAADAFGEDPVDQRDDRRVLRRPSRESMSWTWTSSRPWRSSFCGCLLLLESSRSRRATYAAPL